MFDSNNDVGKILKIDDNGTSVSWVDPTTFISTATDTSNGLMPKSGGGARRVLYTNTFGKPVWTRNGGPGEILKVSDDGTFSWVTPRIDKTERGIEVAAGTEEGTITFGTTINTDNPPAVTYMINAKLEYL